MTAEAGPCGLWPDDLGPTYEPRALREQAVLESRLRQPAQSRRHGRQPGRPGAAARRNAGLCRAPRRSCSTSTASGEARRRNYPDAEQGQDQRRRQMIKFNHSKPRPSSRRSATGAATSTSRRRRASRSRRSARRVETAAAVQAAGEDRRMAKAHLKIQMGGVAAAVEAYRSVADAERRHASRSDRPRRRDARRPRSARRSTATPARASSSSASINDVVLYRELIRRGVSEYLDRAGRHARRRPRRSAACSRRADAKPVGRIVAFVGAKGGVGASTIAHNVAWAIARDLQLDRSSPISTLPSAPPASTSTRIRRRASPTRCSRPTASTRLSSTACCRNAPSI